MTTVGWIIVVIALFIIFFGSSNSQELIDMIDPEEFLKQPEKVQNLRSSNIYSILKKLSSTLTSIDEVLAYLDIIEYTLKKDEDVGIKGILLLSINYLTDPQISTKIYHILSYNPELLKKYLFYAQIKLK